MPTKGENLMFATMFVSVGTSLKFNEVFVKGKRWGFDEPLITSEEVAGSKA